MPEIKWPWRRHFVQPHRHDKRGPWLGDVWDFDEPDEDGAQAVRHTARYRCSCGDTWVEQRPADEYPHMLVNVKVRDA